MFTAPQQSTNKETQVKHSSKRSDLNISLDKINSARSHSEEPRENPELLKRLTGFKERLAAVDTDLAELIAKSVGNPPPNSPILLLRASPSARRNAIADLNDIDASQPPVPDNFQALFLDMETRFLDHPTPPKATAPSPEASRTSSGLRSPVQCWQ